MKPKESESPVEKYLLKLDPKFAQKLRQLNVTTVDGLVQILVKEIQALMKQQGKIQVDIKTTESASPTLPFVYLPLLLEALAPSVSEKLSEEIEETRKRLEQNPQLLGQKQIEDEVDQLIEKRIEQDKEEVTGFAKDVNGMISGVAQMLAGMIARSEGGSESLQKLRGSLAQVKITELSSANLSTVRQKMVEIADSMHKELAGVKEELKNKQVEVQQMESRIQELESKLLVARAESLEDPLTTALSRRGLDRELAKAEENFQRYAFDYAVVFLDLDFFKKINDTYGHDAGDKILYNFAQLIKNDLRKSDIIGRYGGEEFVVVLEGTDFDGARIFANKIRQNLERFRFSYQKQILQVTLSAGVAVRSESDSLEGLLKLADARLYQAKDSGRNRVCP